MNQTVVRKVYSRRDPMQDSSVQQSEQFSSGLNEKFLPVKSTVMSDLIISNSINTGLRDMSIFTNNTINSLQVEPILGESLTKAKAGSLVDKGKYPELKLLLDCSEVPDIELDELDVDLTDCIADSDDEKSSEGINIKRDSVLDEANLEESTRIHYKLKNDVISSLSTLTIKEVSKKYNLSESTVSRWKYENIGKDYKLKVVSYFKVNGAKATVDKYSLSKYFIYKWVRELTEWDLKTREYDGETKMEVVEYYQKHGWEPTCLLFKICHRTLYRWVKELKDHEIKKPKRNVRRKYVINPLYHCDDVDTKEENDSDNNKDVPDKKRDDLDRIEYLTRSKVKKQDISVPRYGKNKIIYSEVFKSQVLKFYSKKGPAVTLRRFGIGKRTLFDWIKKGGVRYYKEIIKKQKENENVKVIEDFNSDGIWASSLCPRVDVNRIKISIDQLRVTGVKSIYDENELNYNGEVDRQVHTIDESFRSDVEQNSKTRGLLNSCHTYNLNSSLIYQWMKRRKSSKSQYSKEFKNRALNSCNRFGISATSRALQVSTTQLRYWLESGRREIHRSITSYSDTFKEEVVKFKQEFGITEAINKYEVHPSQINRWSGRFNMLCSSQNTLKQEVIKYSKVKGIKAASIKYKIKPSIIWDWRQRYLKQKKSNDSTKQPIKRQCYDEVFKDAVVTYAKGHGCTLAGGKFSVPRTTVRNWVLCRGEAEIRACRLTKEKVTKVLAKAKIYGLKHVIMEERIKRSTMEKWARKFGPEVLEQRPSIGKRNRIFAPYTKLPKRRARQSTLLKGVKKKRSIKSPPTKDGKQIKSTNEEFIVKTLELPSWAEHFLKGPKKSQEVESKTSALLSSTSKIVLVPITDVVSIKTSRELSITISVKSKETSEQSITDDGGNLTDEEILIPMPMFAPNWNVPTGSRVTVDPPSLFYEGRPNTPSDALSLKLNYDSY